MIYVGALKRLFEANLNIYIYVYIYMYIYIYMDFRVGLWFVYGGLRVYLKLMYASVWWLCIGILGWLKVQLASVQGGLGLV